MAIEFSFASVFQEIRVIRELATPLLDQDNIWKLDTFESALATIQSNRVRANWTLSLNDPLRTRHCEGGYERYTHESNRRGGKNALYGELSSIWDITPLPEVRKTTRPTKFIVSGIASSKVRLVEDTSEGHREYVSWRMEIGDRKSPGSFFHIQIGEDDADSQVHQPLPVPRIPCPPVTPLLALEFMLAELFQNEWPDRLAAERDRANEWSSIQAARYEAFLNWQHQILKKRSGSVLVSLKSACPDANLLTR